MTDQELIYARLAPGSSKSWLRLLAAGWAFPDWIVEPMVAHHGRHAVLMVRGAA